MDWRHWLTLILLLYWNPAQGYIVSGPLSLDKLSQTADIVFKGTATSSVTGNGEWDEANQKTEFKLISVIKGQSPGNSVNFFHYDKVSPEGIEGYEPQHYHFEPGHTYLCQTSEGLLCAALDAAYEERGSRRYLVRGR